LTQVFEYGAVLSTFNDLKWYLVPPNFKDCCIRHSWKMFKYCLK